MSEENNVEQPVKRGRGNPNWGKKKESDTGTVTVSVADNSSKSFLTDDVVWLNLYSAILSTYTSAGPAICRAAASNADSALNEYKSRFNK
jgi:hypothetical protein